MKTGEETVIGKEQSFYTFITVVNNKWKATAKMSGAQHRFILSMLFNDCRWEENSETLFFPVENSRSLWVNKTTYSLFFSLNCQFLSSSFFTASRTIFDKDSERATAVKNAEVSNHSESSFLIWSTSMKFNHPVQD